MLSYLPDEFCQPSHAELWKDCPFGACVLNTLEGSRASTYQLIERYRQKSHAQFHYEPHGLGVRFAGEPLTSVDPGAKVVGTFAVFGLAIVLARLAQSPQIQRWQPDAVQTR